MGPVARQALSVRQREGHAHAVMGAHPGARTRVAAARPEGGLLAAGGPAGSAKVAGQLQRRQAAVGK